MKRRILITLCWSFFVASLVCAICWASSHHVLVIAVWTDEDDHNQIVSFDGNLYLVQNHNWWRKEEFRVVYDPQPGTIPIVKWPGMRIESHSEFLGFERVRGQWISPFVEVRADTEFTSSDRTFETGMMLTTTTAMDIYGAPYWSMVFFLSALAITLLFAIRKMPAPQAGPTAIANDRNLESHEHVSLS